MRWLWAGALTCVCLVSCGGDDGGGGSHTGGKAGTGATGGGGTSGSGGTGATGATGGTSGGSGGTGGSAGTCAQASECPVPAQECLEAACVAGSCGTAPLAVGTPAKTQVAKDCQRVDCDGAGATQIANDDTDIDDDGNPCTVDGCSAGAPVHTPVAVGTACNSTGQCDAQGQCVECLTATDCGAATDCAAPSCDNGKCGVKNSAVGTPVALQTSGDCKLKVCDGSGGAQEQTDATDVPDDSNTCTTDSCVNGAPTHTPQAGAACGTSGVCNSQGQCVGCNSPADCTGTDDFCKTKICTNNVCGVAFTAANTPLPGASQAAGDCVTLVCNGSGASQPIAAPSDVPVDGNACTLDQCSGSTPQNPPESAGTACTTGGGKVCDGAGQCVGCNTAADCAAPSGFPCVVATCTSAKQCGTSNAAANTPCGGGTCASGVAQLQDKCDGSGACVDGGSANCTPYVCGPTACTSSCANDNGCASSFACDTGLAVCTNGPKCTDYCNTIMANCTGTNQQYFSLAACLASCADLPKGATTDTGGDSVGCRTYHAVNAASGPVVHCPHAGPGGAGVCGPNCDGFCNIALAACTGANQVYSSMAQCLTECATFPTSPTYNSSVTTGNSFACRMYHLTNATLSPAIHCSHIGAASPVCQ